MEKFFFPSKNFAWLLSLLFGLISILLVACNTQNIRHLQPTIPSPLVYLAKLMLDKKDIPSNWHDDGEIFLEDRPGAEALLRGFEATTDPYNSLFLKQELRFYGSIEDAVS